MTNIEKVQELFQRKIPPLSCVKANAQESLMGDSDNSLIIEVKCQARSRPLLRLVFTVEEKYFRICQYGMREAREESFFYLCLETVGTLPEAARHFHNKCNPAFHVLQPVVVLGVPTCLDIRMFLLFSATFRTLDYRINCCLTSGELKKLIPEDKTLENLALHYLTQKSDIDPVVDRLQEMNIW